MPDRPSCAHRFRGTSSPLPQPLSSPSLANSPSPGSASWPVVPATSPSPASSRAVSPVALSASGLHELALEAFRVGNRGRLSLCEVLRILSETRLYLDLGFSSVAAYADTFFQLGGAEGPVDMVATISDIFVAPEGLRLVLDVGLP